MESWESFFVAEVGASAVLAGLIFIGVSINLEKILRIGGLPARALQALVLFVAALLMASLPLVPGVPPAVLGAIVLALGLAVVAACSLLAARSLAQSTGDIRAIAWWNGVLVEVAAVPYVVAGIVILAGWPGGLYWIAGGVLFSFVKGCADAWVLLVEINR